MALVSRADLRWVRDVLMPRFGLKKVTIVQDDEKKGKYPDIWCFPHSNTVVVTKEWARQPMHERRKRLTHEVGGHLALGLGHGNRERRIGFYSHPARDTFSKGMYERFLRR